MGRLTRKVFEFDRRCSDQISACGNELCRETCKNCPIQEAIKKLCSYEDLDEQGKLLKLPCAVGDTAYRIDKRAKDPIIPMEVREIGTLSLKTGDSAIQIKCRDSADGGETSYLNTDFGKIIFFVREEAESALKKI